MVNLPEWKTYCLILNTLISKGRDSLETEKDHEDIATIRGKISAYRTMIETPYFVIENLDNKRKSQIEKEIETDRYNNEMIKIKLQNI